MGGMPPRWRSLGVALCLLAGVLRAPGITVRITEADGTRVQVSLFPGDVLRVDLPAQPAAGLQWSLSGHTPAQLETLAATQRVFGGRLSNQGSSSFAWKAASAGEADITLGYGSPSARALHPDRTLLVHVAIADGPSLAGEPAPAGPPALYRRVEPCGDCSALEETLSLYGPTAGSTIRSTRFVLRRRYQGAPGGTLTTYTGGRYTTRLGTVDPKAFLYQLAGGDGDSLLRADGDRLVPLDAQEIPLAGPPEGDISFHKVSQP
jgi:predicted secreted protein